MARTRKGQIITLKQTIMHEQFKDCAVGEDWVVISGGKTTIALPVPKDGSKQGVLSLDDGQISQYFELTDRKGEVPVHQGMTTYNLSYQWNDAIRSLHQ